MRLPLKSTSRDTVERHSARSFSEANNYINRTLYTQVIKWTRQSRKNQKGETKQTGEAAREICHYKVEGTNENSQRRAID